MARDRASRPEAKPLRLFVAIDVPDDVRASLAETVEPLRRALPGRWTPSHNWHVTLKFLGSTYPRLVDPVVETVREVAASHEPVETRITELGAFPNPKRARVLWAGLHDPSGHFAAIARDLDRALASDFKTEKRAFTPHLTVARFQPPVPVGGAIEGIEGGSRPFTVDRLVLYRSHLQRPAPRYEALEEFVLGR